MPVKRPRVDIYSTFTESDIISITMFRYLISFSIAAMSYFQCAGNHSFGFPPKTIGNHVFWDPTFGPGLVKISRRF